MDDLPQETLDKKIKEFTDELDSNLVKNPKEFHNNILKGKLASEFDDLILLNQKANFWNAEKTINDYLKDLEKQLGFKVTVSRFKIFKSS